MEAFESECQAAIEGKILPQVLLAASSTDGSLSYSKYIGNANVDDGGPPVSSVSTMLLASATKLVTCVAVMQLVERGIFNLDADVIPLLPELRATQVLTGFDEANSGEAILEAPKSTITLRLLLSHTSGIRGLEDERIARYFSSIGDDRGSLGYRFFGPTDTETKATALEELRSHITVLTPVPFSFQPGTEWGYGQGIDWAGRALERLTNMSLEDYCRKNIFKPLGMLHSTFRPLERSDVERNLIQVCRRGQDGTVANTDSFYPLKPNMDMGGAGLYSSTPDYMALLQSLTRNDGKVLLPKTVDNMFDYRLPDTPGMNKFRVSEEILDNFGDRMPNGLRGDHCLAGIVNLNDLTDGPKAGSIFWSGAYRCFWWIDGKSGVYGFYGSQLMVPGDGSISRDWFHRFQSAVYRTYKT